ncbi:hypothetical protein SDC9_54244 [bioreactor metagenome]|uniref:Uncharacterized protein n=1 Tax=bioreactor metagenome TaxID=1076179 RepID=A0A644X0W0_9ZZZZ
MTQLFKYSGTVSQFGFDGKGSGTADLILDDISDWDKPPVRIAAHGALARYISDIEGTDAEERYINSDWYYDRNLFLYRIEVPSSNEFLPAKVITQADFLSDELAIFGPQEYIETSKPEPMSAEQSAAWGEYRIKY